MILAGRPAVEGFSHRTQEAADGVGASWGGAERGVGQGLAESCRGGKDAV